VTIFLNGSFPILTPLWILIPLIAVARSKDAGRVGFRSIPWAEFLRVSAVNLGGLLLVALLIEPWSHTYQKLLELALSSATPDTTFAWLVRFPRIPALGEMFLFSGSVTMFGEELFFRGWLLQLLQRRWGTLRAVVLQALLFVLPNLLVSLVLPPLQGVLYALVYTWLAVGMIGGWAAARTQSIWPGLFSAVAANLLFVAFVL